jgi:flagellar hook-associated protein 1 FlgK
MATSNILSIGKTALNAAQVGISTTGHNIANASTAGYSRQVILQSAASSQNFGYGYVGQGTEVSSITRVYNDLIAKQVTNSQSISSGLNTYAAQMSTIDNMLSDASAGLTPTLNDFFASVKSVSANPSDASTRQTMLSNAQSLVSRFQSTSSRFDEMRSGVNTQLSANVSLVNTYAKELSSLNDTIDKAISATGNQPNDLLDQRDQLVTELSKLVKTSVVSQGQGGYNVYIGNGLPLVVGTTNYTLNTIANPNDPGRLEVAYQSNNKQAILSADSLPGGTIGGLLQFRAESLDPTQNKIGQIAVALASTYNAQLTQGTDKNGNPGTALFAIAAPLVNSNSNNTGTGVVNSQIVDGSAVTNSDYRLQYDGTNYNITRLSDKSVQSFTSLPQVVDGVSFSLGSGTINANDEFLIKPTTNAANTMTIAISDVNKLAIGGPVLTSSANGANTGSATLSSVTANSSYAASPLASPLTMTYNSGVPGTFSMAPSTQPVTVSNGGTSTTYAPGAPITYTSGSTISVGSISFVLSGTPANGDAFTVAPSTSTGPSDNRNGLLLANLESKGTVQVAGSTTKNSYNAAFAQIVSGVGSKTRELKVTAAAESQVLESANTAMQSESGVNLDEEAANLLRYQQAYQAAGKMMQIASQLFDVLLQIG